MIGEVAAPRQAGSGVRFGLGVLVLAAAVTLTGIGRAAYWADEATTVMLTRWTWPDLLGVIRGPEAPLGPYYLLLKPWVAVGGGAEWWVRLPSALGTAVAVALLAGWARRVLGTVPALAGVAVLLALPVTSRYAQEARPYGLLLLAATGCVLAWWRWRERGGTGAAAGYAVSVAVLPLVHVLALTLVVAQVVAAAVSGGPVPGRSGTAQGGTQGGTARGRVRGRSSGPGAAVRTAALAAAGLVPMLPYLVLVRSQAMGVAFPLPLTWANAGTTFAAALAGPPRTDPAGQWLALGVVALAVIGTTAARDRAVRPVVVALACWAVVPPVLLALAAVRLETLVPRYAMVAVPAWALLAGLGAVRLGRAVGGLFGSGRAAASVAVLVAAAPVVALLAVGLPHQTAYRSAAGHDNGDVRPAVRLLASPGYRQLPVVLLPQAWWVILADAYDPALPARTPLADGPRLGPDRHILLREVGPGTAADRLTGVGSLAVLVHTGDAAAAGQAARDKPELARYAIARVDAFDGWSVVLLTRTGRT